VTKNGVSLDDNELQRTIAIGMNIAFEVQQRNFVLPNGANPWT
jgi:hypothetical protein